MDVIIITYLGMDYTNMDDTSPIHPPDRLDELKKSIG